MRKKNLKIFVGLIVAIIIAGIFTNTAFAVNETEYGYDFDTFTKSSFSTNASADTAAQNLMATIINTIRIIGTGTSIIMITYLGIKYMSAAPNEKAEFKKSASIFILGAVLVFAATNILAIIYDFTSTNIGT